MAFLQTSFFSRVLNVESTVNVILPEAYQGIGVRASEGRALPRVLYLLHGYSDDHSIWMRRTSVERYAARHHLAVIMPAVNHSWYMNEPRGERYWDYVSDELPEIMQSFFRISAKQEDTYVAGLSMGGYGAMRLALTYPERFAAACSLSGAVDILRLAREESEQFSLPAILREYPEKEIDNLDLMKLMEKPCRHRPKLYVACGTEDFLFGHHTVFIPALEKNGWQVEHTETPNESHTWEYWDTQIEYFIDHYCK